MARDTAMNVSLMWQGQKVDLRLPRLMSETDLKALLHEHSLILGLHLPASFELLVADKTLELDRERRWDRYAIGDGDQIEIRETV